jgi:hypothetical protein
MSPNQPKTPMLAVRVPRELQDAARERARERGETVTDVIVRALKRYVRTPTTTHHLTRRTP